MEGLYYKLRKRVNPLFSKILLYFLSLIILVFIMGVTTYMNSVRQMREDFSGKIMTNLQTSANIIDNNLRTAQEISMNFFYNEIVQSHLKPVKDITISDRVYLPKIGSIISRNKSLLGKFIDNIFVYLDDQSVYTSEGNADFNTYLSKFYKYDNMDAAFWNKMLYSNKYLEILPLSKVTRKYGSPSNVIPIVYTSIVNGYRMVMVLNISADDIYKSIQKNTIISSTDFLVLDSKNSFIFASEESYKEADIKEKFQRPFSDETSGSREYGINGNKGLITFLKSPNYGWSYYLFTPMDEFGRHSGNVLNLTLLFCIILAGIGVFFSFIFTAKIYNPIRKIRDTLRENEETAQPYKTGRRLDDFTLIGMGISSLKEQGIQFKMEQELLLNEYLDNSLIYVIEGNKPEQKDILEKIMQKQLGFHAKGYLCCNVLLQFKEAFYKDMQDVDRINIINGIKKIISAIMEDYVRLYVLEYRQNVFICIIDAMGGGTEELVKKAADIIINCFKYDMEYCDIFIGIGKQYRDINGIAKSYADAATALANRQKSQGMRIIDSAFLSIENSVDFSFTDEIKVHNLLSTGDYGALCELTGEIVKNNIEKSTSHGSMVKLFKRLYDLGLSFLSEKGLNSMQTTIDREAGIVEYDNRITIDYSSTLELLNVFYKNIIDKTCQRHKSRENDMATMIEAYVESHYSKDLYLEKIADEMGVSIKHISKVFKYKIGINLTDYISRIRVEKIKELLKDTDMNIGDISQKVGIFSRATFIRTFKKFEGITPSEYRELYRNNAQ